ncbi:hypothetical protein MTR_1g015310 [Medicago truncatula]|uniref:Uncharacterized protein n=1 Tax=Medicago truncatula TaxID=3880 RepID=G7I905_MEDTR|nr:hypothetical protein MTR_1g015310 [Medicago truncatula]
MASGKVHQAADQQEHSWETLTKNGVIVVNFRHYILQYPCSHVIAACSKIQHDFMMYVSLRYTLQYVFNTYKEEGEY